MWPGKQRIHLLALVTALLSVVQPAAAQLRATAVIALSATLPSSVTLSDSQVPVTIVVSNGNQAVSGSVVNIKWNLDTRTAGGFRIVGTLVGSTLPSTSLEASADSSTFRPLAQNGSIVLMNKNVSTGNGQGDLQTSVELRFSDAALSGLPDGVYQGWLKLEAQIL